MNTTEQIAREADETRSRLLRVIDAIDQRRRSLARAGKGALYIGLAVLAMGAASVLFAVAGAVRRARLRRGFVRARPSWLAIVARRLLALSS